MGVQLIAGGNPSLQTITNSAEEKTEQLNQQLQDILYDMQNETIQLQNVNNMDNALIQKNAEKIEGDIEKLKEQKKLIQTLKNEISSLDGNIRDARYLVDSTNMKYIAWGVSLTTIILLILFLKK